MNPVADRLDTIAYSNIREIFDRANDMERKGIHITHMEIGRPDFDTPDNIKKAAIEKIKRGFVHYTANRGISELREEISRKLKDENQIDADPETDIVVTVGCKEAIFNSFAALINEGDEVIVPTPAWNAYENIIELFGGKPVRLHLDSEENFTINIDKLKKLLTDKTKLIVICNPNNPTGTVFNKDILEEISKVCISHDLYVLSDEIYEKIVYDDVKYTSVASLPGMYERSVTINGFSKAYAMDGWRLGYVIGPRRLIDSILKIHQNNTSCVNTFVQYAGVEAYQNSNDDVIRMVNVFKERRDFLVTQLNAIDRVECFIPQGAFYIFPKFNIPHMDSVKLSKYLLDNAHVACVPGNVFGETENIHLRFSYATSIEDIRMGVKNLKTALDNLT